MIGCCALEGGAAESLPPSGRGAESSIPYGTRLESRSPFKGTADGTYASE